MHWSILLWHLKPVICADTKEIITNVQYFWMSELHPSWQRPQMLDLLSVKGLGSHALLPDITLDFTFDHISHRSNSSWYFRIFYDLLQCWCCHLGLPCLLQLPFSAPCQPSQCLVGWPTAAWRSGTWSPSGCLLYCFQPIFCGSHSVAHVLGARGRKRTAYPSFWHWSGCHHWIKINISQQIINQEYHYLGTNISINIGRNVSLISQILWWVIWIANTISFRFSWTH